MISGIFWCVVFLIFGENLLVLAPLVCALTGGALAVWLTVKKCLDTSGYFALRMTFFIISLIVFTVPAILCVFVNGLFIYVVLDVAVWVVPAELISFLTKTKSLKKTAVIFLSDPLGWDIFILCAVILAVMSNI